MSCKCKNIIENFQGGTIPLDTIFNGNVEICGPGKSLKVSQIDGCSPTTIGSQSGCTSATTTVLIVSDKTNFSCDINTVGGGIFSGGTNLDQLFLPISATADPFVIAGTYIGSTGTISLLRNDGNFVNITGLTDSDFVWTSGSTGNFSVKQITDTTTDATGDYAVAEGGGTEASGDYSHAEGKDTIASGLSSHAEGFATVASEWASHAEGRQTIASGIHSHSEGFLTTASGEYSHTEGNATIASGFASHSEGASTEASGPWSHAGGFNSESSGILSFIHSSYSLVTGDRSVVLGGQNITGSTNDTVYVPYLNINNLGTGTSINNLGIDSSGNVVSGVPKGSIVYTLGHDSISPTDNNDYFIGQNFTLTPSTSSNDSRRFIVQKTGTVTQVSIKKTITGTLGSSETNNFYVNNVTQVTQGFITSGETFDSSSSLTNYTLSTPLNVTAGDKLEIEWFTPAWVTNPTSVRQIFNMIIEY